MKARSNLLHSPWGEGRLLLALIILFDKVGIAVSEQLAEDPKITSIEQQKNNRFRYNIYINEEFAFAVHEDILIKYRLIKGREIAADEIREILEAEEKNRAMQYALRYLSFRPRTTVEVKEHLGKKGFLKQDIEEIVQSLISKKYLDDRSYADQWVEERKRLKPRGRYLLKMELAQRGIDEENADQAINMKLSTDEEKAMIEEWIAKKSKGRKFDSLFDMKKKLIPFLQRKGFPLEVSLDVIHKVGKDYLK